MVEDRGGSGATGLQSKAPLSPRGSFSTPSRPPLSSLLRYWISCAIHLYLSSFIARSSHSLFNPKCDGLME